LNFKKIKQGKKMKYLNPNDKDDVRNWHYVSIFERLKLYVFIVFGGFVISVVALDRALPKGSDFWSLTLGFAMLLTPSLILVYFVNRKIVKSNAEVIKFKNMTEEQQSEYLSRRN
jgi:low temperature requirement protein LtrA